MAKRLINITGEEFVKKIFSKERDFRNLVFEGLDLTPYIKELNNYLIYKSEWSSLLPWEIKEKLDGYSIDISGSQFIRIKGKGLKIPYIKAIGTTFETIDFKESYFWKGNFENGKFKIVNFYNAFLQNTNFRKTMHKEVNFKNSDVSYADFEGADIRGAKNLRLYLTDLGGRLPDEYSRTKVTAEQFKNLRISEKNRLIERLNEQYKVLTSQ